jgi:hypothetical protein
MKKFLARTLLSYTTEELWSMLTGRFVLRFDDGVEVEVAAEETVLSSHAWDYHRKYQRTPLLKHHHMSSVLKGKEYNAKTHLQLFSNVYWSVRDAYEGDEIVTQDLCMREGYHLINQYYNDLIYRCEADVMGLDITDFIAILKHPRVLEAKANAKPTDEGIQEVYRIVQDVLENDPALRDNPVAKYARRGIANMGQVLQCVAVRGFVVDMNGERFRKPIMRGYAEGIVSIDESAMDSRSASLSLASASGPLEDTEYFSRRLQLLVGSIRNLHLVDCGSTTYMEWVVQPERKSGGRLDQRDDLETLAGKYYLKDDGTFGVVRRSDTHLYGKSIKMRSVRHCCHPDPAGVCARCYGQTSESIPLGGSFGQTNTVEMTQQSGQSVLSTKHLLMSAIIQGIIMDEHMQQFFGTNEERSEYRLLPQLARQNVRLVIDSTFAPAMTNITSAKHVETVNASRIADLTAIALRLGAEDKWHQTGFEVGMDGRPARFTSDLVKHIRKVGWTINEQKHYVIDMAGWDYSKSILSVPMRFESMAEHADTIADIIESSMKDMEKRIETDDPDDVLFRLHQHVNQKLVVPLAVLEVILHSAMAVSPRDEDYALPKEGDPGVLGVSLATLKSRTVATFMAYEKQATILDDPRSYVYTNRLSSNFDWILMPREASQHDELTRPASDWETGKVRPLGHVHQTM